MPDNNLGQYPFADILGISLESVNDKKIVLRMKRNSVNVGGVRNSINGGILATYAEIAAHVAINSKIATGSEIKQTQDLSIAYLESAISDFIMAEAHIQRMGKTATVTIELKDEALEKIFCICRVTCAVGRIN
tara:strand:+ start:6595 stop:6993 length:399 start_codon:yes stop_codon:yes gene_type:complete